MKDYPDRMTTEEARKFGEDVLNIVAQIPRGQVTTYGYIAGDDVRIYCRIGWMAESFKDGGENAEIYAWGGETALLSGREQRRSYGSRVESATCAVRSRGRCLQK